LRRYSVGNISNTASVAVVVEMEFSEALAAPLALEGVTGTVGLVRIFL